MFVYFGFPDVKKKFLFAYFLIEWKEWKIVFFSTPLDKVISCYGWVVTYKIGLINAALKCQRMWEFVLILTSTYSKEK